MNLYYVLGAIHKLTDASLGLLSDFFVPYYAPHEPTTVFL